MIKYEQAIALYNQHQFSEAATSFCQLLKSGLLEEEIIFRFAINSFLQMKDYSKVKELSDEFITNGKMDSDDFAIAGLSYSRLGQPDKALELYDKSLELNPCHQLSLNNKGFTFLLLHKFEEAIALFDKAIEYDKTSAYSYNNRGLAKIKMGKVEEGLEDINYSFKLDENDSYAFRNLGIYHLDKEEYSEALNLFKKAKSLDNETYMIDELIVKAKQQKV